MGVFSEEGGGAAVEVEFLGEFGEEREGNDGVFGVGENEVLDGDDFEEVFVRIHEFFESGVSGSGGYILGRGGFGASDGDGGEMGFLGDGFQ